MSQIIHTKTVCRVARAPTALPIVLIGRAVRVWIMLIPDLAEEVDAIPAREECRRDRVDGCITPTLSFVRTPSRTVFDSVGRVGVRIVGLQYLVVKAALAIEVLEERGICFTAPEVQIGDLKIAPDLFRRHVPYHNDDSRKPFRKLVMVRSGKRRYAQWQRL